MSFENKTVEYVNDLIVSGLEQELNTRLRLLPKSFIRVLAKVLSGVYVTLYKQQAWIFLQMFVDTATFDEVEILGRRLRPLVLWGELVGVGDPGDATQWSGTATVTVTAVNTYLDQGTQFKNSATGKIYLTTESRLLANQKESLPVKCATAGTAGNLVIGDELQTVSPLANIERGAITTAVTANGTDPESAETYRSRVRNRWRVQPQGGALSDYRKWSSEVSGVYQTYIYKDDTSAAGVLIYVAADPAVEPSRIPASGVLLAVGDACTYNPATGDARKPIGAVLDPNFDGTYKNIRPVTVTAFDVYITGYNEAEMNEFKTSAKSNVKAYFDGREPYIRGLSVDNQRSDRISVVNVLGILNDIAESLNGYFEGVAIKKGDIEAAAYTLGKGELSKLRSLYINGVAV